jgi:hypothetical protein
MTELVIMVMGAWITIALNRIARAIEAAHGIKEDA